MRIYGSRAALLVMLASACRFGSNSSSAPAAPTGPTTAIPTATAAGTPQGSTASTAIGPSGGTLTTAAGALTLSVPAGSVSSNAQFTATPIVNRAHGGLLTAFRLESTQPLTGPVSITFKGLESYPAGTSIEKIGIRFQDAGGFWVPPDSVTRDAAANTITATSTHLSDWALVLNLGPPLLEGTFTLNQQVGIPFSAPGTASLYAVPGATETAYFITGTITLPPQITNGTATCVPDARTQSLEISTAEVKNAVFRWGLNARWALTCTDTVTGAGFSDELATAFDTLRINLVNCPGTYVGTQVNGSDFVQGSYTSNCGANGNVSATWDFRSCTSGGVCQPTDTCHTGVVTCSLGIATCNDSGSAPDGTSCGTSLVCSGGSCVSCTEGSTCTPANACHVGTQSCTNGPVCIDTGVPVANGSSCGIDAVCGGGTCNACQPGAACVSSNTCHTAALTCNSGFPVCTDTGPVSDGTTCGSNLVCSGGACVGCTPGTPCTPANSCDAGTLSCTSGPVCGDTGTPLPNGTSCGTNAVCGDGSCNSCTAGASCPPPSGNVCHTAAFTCNTGAPVCTESPTVFVADGTSCGTDQVCSNGNCVSCLAGTTCTPPASPCFAGTLSCSAGPVCNATATPLDAGLSCGSGLVCNGSGACVACDAGATCTPSAPCRTGAIACGSGTPVCTANGNLPDGSASTCAPGSVCSGGSCVACAPGSSCTQPNACLIGTLSCTAGPVCDQSAPTPVNAGTSCGTGFVCDGAGNCNACVAGQVCTPTEVCRAGAITCDTGAQVCTAGAILPDGSPSSCAPGSVCSGGSCVTCSVGGACPSPSPCFTGGTFSSCSAGPVCTADPATQVPAGTSCGAGLACDAAGACLCAAGGICAPSNPCLQAGTYSCDVSGSPVCNGGPPVLDGTPCTGGTCTGGVCTP